MTARQYDTTSLTEASSILAQEWSRHRLQVQSGREAFRMRFATRPLSADMSINSLSFGAPVRIDPSARDNVLLFRMPSRGSERAHFPRHDLVIDAGRFAIIDVRNVSFVESDGAFETTVLRIKAARLRAYLERYLDRPLHQDPEFRGAMTQGSAEWEQWQPFASLLSRPFICGRTRLSPLVAAPLEEAIIAALLQTQPSNFSALIAHPKPSAAPRHVKAAEAYIYENAHHPLTTSELAEHAQVSIRALFDGFRQFRGVTPAQFVRQVRLDGARRDLMIGHGNVLDIAERWGFGHPGNFAAHYLRKFGEKPAETLRRSAPRRRRRH